MSLTSINLPLPILIHGIGMTVLGLALTFRRPLSPTNSKGPIVPDPVAHTHSMLGITTTAIGLCYLTTSHVPIAYNTMLYASVPVRILLAVLLLSVVGLRGKEFTGEGRKTFVGFALYDGLSGLWLGWYLGEWFGRAPGLVGL